jgi:hypothetical protein
MSVNFDIERFELDVSRHDLRRVRRAAGLRRDPDQPAGFVIHPPEAKP